MRKIPFLFMAFSLFFSCKKITDPVTICHKISEHSGDWITLQIDASDLSFHLGHGDILPDADGDGYTIPNPCEIGVQKDCDDANRLINPAAMEICNNGIDDNCNGQQDENCKISVTICDQEWMIRNLDVSTYRNGDMIPQVTDRLAWMRLTTGAWCFYANSTANGTIYGKLYNWYAVNDPRGLAPAGWHVASDAEWTALANCLGGAGIAGGKLKETGTTHWRTPNTAADNSTGFTGLPGGFRLFSGEFDSISSYGLYWTSTESNATEARYWTLNYSVAIANRSSDLKLIGFSVRCVRN